MPSTGFALRRLARHRPVWQGVDSNHQPLAGLGGATLGCATLGMAWTDRAPTCAACSVDSRDWQEHTCGGWLVSHLHEHELLYREQATLDELALAGWIDVHDG
jgi:hypothetical protein